MDRATRFIARAPCRVDPAGGGTDAPPYCVEYGGAVVNFSMALYATASVERLPAARGTILHSHDLQCGLKAPRVSDLPDGGPLAMLVADLKRLMPDADGLLLQTEARFPSRSGLGGSGSMGVAITAALCSLLERPLSPSETALLANDIERTDMGLSGGSQDAFGAAVGGAKLITYRRGGGTACRRLKLHPDIQRAVQDDGLLVYTGEQHFSETIHEDIRAAYLLPDSPVIAAMDQLKAAALAMAKALEGGDFGTYVDCLNRSCKNLYALHPTCDSPRLRECFEALDPYILGGKACGAGGGGHIFVQAKPGQREACIAAARKCDADSAPFAWDDAGVQVMAEAPTTAGRVYFTLGNSSTQVRHHPQPQVPE